MPNRLADPRYSAVLFWIALAGWIAFLRAPSFVDAFFDPDVAATAYSAQLFAHGSCIYPDAVETKPPGSYAVLALLLAVVRNMAGVHVAMVLYHLAVAAVLARLVARRGGVIAGRSAALAYGSYSALGFVNGYAPNFETWTLLPLSAAAMLLSEEAESPAAWRALAVGALAGMAVLMKQQAAIVVAALGLAVLVLPRPTTGRRARPVALALFAVGALVPWAVTLVYFVGKGCAGDLVAALSPARNATYVAANHPGEILARAGRFFGTFSRYAWFLLAAAVLGVAAMARSVKARPLLLVPGLWLAGALVATWAGTMFFPHYALLLVPPLAVLAGVGMGAAVGARREPLVRIAIALVVVGLLAANLHREIQLATVAARDLVRTGRVESRELFRINASYGPRWNTVVLPIGIFESEAYSRMAGEYIRAHSTPSDTILVYDYVPSVYWYARRRAPTRHHMNFDVAWELPEEYGRWFSEETERLRRNRAELLRDLAARPPRFFVRVRYDRPAVQDATLNPANVYGDPLSNPPWRAPLFPALRDFVERHYRPAAGAPDIPLSILERDDATFP